MIGLRWIQIGSLLFVLVAAGACGRSSQPVAPALDAETVEEPVLAINETTSVSIEGTVRAIWWNQERYIDSLQLDQGQRVAMDQALIAYLDIWTEQSPVKRNSQKALMIALRADDLERAQQVASELAEASGALDGGMMTLKIQVFGMLDASQRETLLTKNRRLFLRRWVSAGRIRASENRE